jgi:hypothetical protein
MAAIDRLVHHAMILEFDGDSVRAQKAQGREKGQPQPTGDPCGSTTPLPPDGGKDSVPPQGSPSQK